MNATVLKYLRNRRLNKVKQEAATKAETQGALLGADDVPLSRRLSRTQSRAASIHESLYSNRTSFLKKTMRRFGEGFGGKVKMKEEELKRFGNFQTKRAGQMLTRQPSGAGENGAGESGAGENQFTA